MVDEIALEAAAANDSTSRPHELTPQCMTGRDIRMPLSRTFQISDLCNVPTPGPRRTAHQGSLSNRGVKSRRPLHRKCAVVCRVRRGQQVQLWTCSHGSELKMGPGAPGGGKYLDQP
jgi:hypothetical protein